jgi:hypothetical protein
MKRSRSTGGKEPIVLEPDEQPGGTTRLEAQGGDQGLDGDELASDLINMVLEARTEREVKERAAAAARAQERIEGVVIGRLAAVTPRGPKVSYPGCPSPDGLVARATAKVRKPDVGRRVALMFENGDPGLPIFIGLLHHDGAEAQAEHPALRSLTIREEHDRIDIKCMKGISLSCGESTIIITPKGKILLRSKHLLSHASILNRIRGGSVRIN